MRVGILTFPHTTNYGATLQGWALRRRILDLGHDCGLLDYRHPRAMRVYNGLTRSRHAPQVFFRKRRFVAFEARELGLIGPPAADSAGLARLCDGLDAVVVGSDQVWDSTGFRGWCPEMYLDFVPGGCRRIAYAPSCGMTTDAGERADFLRGQFAGFDAISARDANTASFVEGLTGSRPRLVLDPTFLADFAPVTPSKRPIAGGYLLVYAGLPARTQAVVRDAARAMNLKIVSIGYAFAGADRQMISAGPAEFLGAYAGASFVVTSFFHGTIFAILNRVPFVSFLKADKTIKVSDLLGRLGLERRMLPIADEPTPIGEDLFTLDYGASEDAIARETAASRAFLEGALDGRA